MDRLMLKEPKSLSCKRGEFGESSQLDTSKVGPGPGRGLGLGRGISKVQD